jgi:hypothetical protein
MERKMRGVLIVVGILLMAKFLLPRIVNSMYPVATMEEVVDKRVAAQQPFGTCLSSGMICLKDCSDARCEDICRSFYALCKTVPGPHAMAPNSLGLKSPMFDWMLASPSARNELVMRMSKAMPDNVPVSPLNFSKCLDRAAQNRSAGTYTIEAFAVVCAMDAQ